MAKVTDIYLGKDEIAIHVDSDGRFHAEYEEEHVYGDTLPNLKDELQKRFKKTQTRSPIDVSIVGKIVDPAPSRYSGRGDRYISGIGVVNAVLRGQNSRLRDWLLTSEDNYKFSLGGSDGRRIICRRLSSDESLEYIRLARAIEFAKEQLESWTAERRIDPKVVLGE